VTDKKIQSLQRVLDCAARIFTDRRFEAVSVNEIAALAHCSTATIYDVYGNKESLFLAAITYKLDNIVRPRIVERDGSPLERLLAYAEARARWLAAPEQRKVTRSLLCEHERVGHLVRDDMTAQYVLTTKALSQSIRKCLAAGLLREFGEEALAHNILAGTIYEPLVFGLVYGEEAPVDFADILRKVFTPLVSDKGAFELGRYLNRMSRALQENTTFSAA
jgi:AcrR family transcriptional regulator